MFTIGVSTFSVTSTIVGAFIFAGIVAAGFFTASWGSVKEARKTEK